MRPDERSFSKDRRRAAAEARTQNTEELDERDLKRTGARHEKWERRNPRRATTQATEAKGGRRACGSEHPQFTGRIEVLRDRNDLEASQQEVGSEAGCERLGITHLRSRTEAKR